MRDINEQTKVYVNQCCTAYTHPSCFLWKSSATAYHAYVNNMHHHGCLQVILGNQYEMTVVWFSFA